jgi:hypothetical protein
MWTISATDFLPHVLAGDPLAAQTPIILTDDAAAELPHHDILVNLSQLPPPTTRNSSASSRSSPWTNRMRRRAASASCTTASRTCSQPTSWQENMSQQPFDQGIPC